MRVGARACVRVRVRVRVRVGVRVGASRLCLVRGRRRVGVGAWVRLG